MSTGSNNQTDLALLLLRIGVGLVFIIAGWGKLTGIEGTQAFFADVGIPMAGIMAWVVALVEFIGGIMVLIGAYTRIPLVLLAIIMVVAILTVKLGAGWDAMRLDVMLLLASVSLYFLGTGAYSVDAALQNQNAASGAKHETA